VLLDRRQVVLSLVALMSAGCRQASARPPRAAGGALADSRIPTAEAQSILSDALDTLRTFDSFQAFRVSNAEGSAMRLSYELLWDAPTSTAWDEATHVTRGLRGRADQLFQALTSSPPEPATWREQRRLAGAAHALLELGDALGAYRDRVDVLPPGDASGALALLETAWSQWDVAAALWGVSRAEVMTCRNAS
jgi:hypothetical protein